MAKKRRLRIASYNINGINSRLNVLTRWLEEFQPDIVGLQELKCTDDAFPQAAIEALPATMNRCQPNRNADASPYEWRRYTYSPPASGNIAPSSA